MSPFVCSASLAISVLLGFACANSNTSPIGQSTSSARTAKDAESWSQKCTEQDSTDVLHHDIELSVLVGTKPSITGRGTLRVRTRRSTSVLVLDAHALRVSAIQTGTTRLRFQQVEDHLCIELPEPLAAGGEASVELTWQVSTHGEVPRLFSDQAWAGYRASAWMPTRQDPAQRATLALRIVAPADLKVAASGRLLARTQEREGFLLHSFVQELPSPPFLYALAAGHFEEVERHLPAIEATEGVTLRALGPKGSDLTGALAITEVMYQLLVERTGASFPGTEYTQVFVHGDAAQEAAGLSLLAESSLDDLRNDPAEDWIFSHELAHQWFGWLVPCADFADFWLNEGFATFFVAVVKEQRFGRAAYEHEVALWRERSARVHAEGKDAPLSLSAPNAPARAAPTETELQPRGVTYFRGALVLHKLRSELGEQPFWAGIRRYVASQAGKSARTEDFRRALEAASGLDLTDFFARWVYASAPEL